MGNWGTGFLQSDTYCETYEKFIEEYDKGKPISQITQDILEEWFEEFEEDDGILHDVYFALGKAEWMCGGVSEPVFNRINEIIKSGKDIDFWHELSATPSDLKQRQEALNSFLISISKPRGIVKKRKIPKDKYIAVPKSSFPPMPKVKDGDIFAYKNEDSYRAFVIVRHQKAYGRTVVFCYLCKEEFATLPSIHDLFNTHIMPLGYLNSDTFPKEDKRIYIGNSQVIKKLGLVRSPEIIFEKWKIPVFSLATNSLLNEYPYEQCLTLNDALNKI